MKDNTIHLFIAVFLVGIVSVIGCGKARLPGLTKCEGTVIWNGKPVEGAFVAFSPRNNSDGRSAGGATDANGKFKATTLDDNDGIMPGEYVVTITKMAETREGGPEVGDPTDSRTNRGRHVPETITQTHLIPQVYANRETSGLSATISSKGSKDLLFELVGEIQHRPAR